MKSLIGGVVIENSRNLKINFASLAGIVPFFLHLVAMMWSRSAFAEKPFDDYPADYSLNLADAPMYTLVGITDWGKSILEVYGITTWVLVIVFAMVAVPCVYTLYRFRATGKETELPKQVKGNHLLELVWTVIPFLLLIIIAIPTWRVIFEQEDMKKKAAISSDVLKIDAIGHQWWWEFKYTQLGVTTANELILPENTPVEFTILSKDVIHSFYIPRFGGKLDAIPGGKNKLVYTTPTLVNKEDPEGDFYQGHCLELCGLSHALMRFGVYVRSQADFDKFIATHNLPPVVMTESEKRGEELFAICMGCHSIEGTPSADLPVEKIGPNLSNFGNRKYLGAHTRLNTMENLKAWIKNPESIKPGSRMKSLGISDDQIEDVAAYVKYSTTKDLR